MFKADHSGNRISLRWKLDSNVLEKKAFAWKTSLLWYNRTTESKYLPEI